MSHVGNCAGDERGIYPVVSELELSTKGHWKKKTVLEPVAESLGLCFKERRQERFQWPGS